MAARYLCDAAMRVGGIDLSSNRVAVAVKNRNKYQAAPRGGSARLSRRRPECAAAVGGCDDGARPPDAPDYDLIAFFDVLEHLAKPRALLELSISMQQLSPGGFIVGVLPIDKLGRRYASANFLEPGRGQI